MVKRLVIVAGALAIAAACTDATGPDPVVPNCAAFVPAASGLTALGCGGDTTRFTAEVAVRGNTAYTTSWGSRRGVPGNRISIWDVTGNTPRLLDSVVVDSASQLGDVTVTDDGRYLVVATEFVPGSIVIFDLTNPRAPRRIARYSTAATRPGVHTAEVARVNGVLHGFLSIDPGGGNPARLIIVELSDPASPRLVLDRFVGRPYVHDVFSRDGLLFLALWDDGLQIWDIGGGTLGGTPANPRVIGSVETFNGNAHNVWWFHDPTTGSKRYAFVGEEGPSQLGVSSSGDIHVIDVSDMTRPREVAVYTVPGAGTHNFSMDEQRGILYAAYYNGGVRAIDVRGDLGSCSATQRFARAETLCDLGKMGRELGGAVTGLPQSTFLWGVQYSGGAVYASDMLNGLWKLQGVTR